uniref:C2H2-type domain-containing protein n=1 Tax=Timema cristinae TaxID=61476 RepID=A0A7R9D5U8_TIMCR|nr:unnamed protein product [Timema cristinae]
MTMDINVQHRGKHQVHQSTALISSNVGSTASNNSPPTTPPPGSESPLITSYKGQPYSSLPATTTIPLRNIKRSFDVAFLMAPDENLAKKQQQERHQHFITSASMLKRSSPTLIQTTAFEPISPNSVINAKNQLFNTVQDTIQKNKQDLTLLEGVLDSVSRSSYLLRSMDSIPNSHNQRLVISRQQSSKVGLFEHTNLSLMRPSNDQEDIIEEVSKVQSTISERQELNLINISTQREDFNDDIHSTSINENNGGGKPLFMNTSGNSPGIMIRSAFTKVTTSSTKFDARNRSILPLQASPSSVSSLSGEGLSPDHISYQESMSPPVIGGGPNTSPIPSPFMQAAKSYPSPVPLLMPNPHLAQHIPSPVGKSLTTSYSSAAFLLQQESGSKHIKDNDIDSHTCMTTHTNGNFKNDIDNYLMKASITAANHHQLYGNVAEHEFMQCFPGNSVNTVKIRPNNLLYHHPESIAAYSSLAAAAYPFSAAKFTNSAAAADLLVTRAQPPSLLSTVNNSAAAAAAAVVSASLLPPSFAALSLPAQNVCAKCNISFRMTSDLVYHMRSHHKGDHMIGDPMKRRREQDKLKCPVCNESFRERHHLTRHMTAHQDKEGDVVDEYEDGERTTSSGVEIAGRRRMASSGLLSSGNHGGDK